jgi:prevent-host-death family protein
VFLAAAAKTRFSALVDEAVATHEQITVTRNGEPAVVPTASGIDLTTRP